MADNGRGDSLQTAAPGTLVQRVTELEADLQACRREMSQLRSEYEQYRRIADFALDLERVFSAIHVSVAYLDCSFNFLHVNQAYAAADNRNPEFFVGKNHFELYPNPENEAIFRRVAATGKAYITRARPFVYPNSLARGVTYWDWTLQPVFDVDGNIDGLVLCMVNVTDNIIVEEALRTNQQMLQTLIDHIPACILVKDTDQRYLLINSEYEHLMLHRSRESVIGLTDEEMLADLSGSDHLSPEEDRLMRSLIDQWSQENPTVLKHGSSFKHEISLPTRDRIRTYLSSKFPLYDAQGTIMGLGVIALDITPRKEMEQVLKEQVIRDPLTGLYNRRYLDETLPRELQRADRHNQSVGVIMLDLDHFKRFNDTYGHDAGDKLLRIVGQFLQKNTRGDDVACRYGGEEFILVLPGASHETTWQRAEEIRVGIQQLVVRIHDWPLEAITASLGVAIFPDHHNTADGIIKAADQALYNVKRNGRNRVIGYSS
jgi:diguanylate cyclase (GGDEF)-like protein